MSDEGFLSRWSRRKVQAKGGAPAADAAPHFNPLPPMPAVTREPEPVAFLSRDGRGTEDEASTPAAAPDIPPPTLADVAELTPHSDYARFLAPQVDESVKRAALKKLFTDPHFNVMDGLDTYIDDYSQPDPIPESMLRRMAQSQFLGLFDDERAPDEPKASPDGEAVAALSQSNHSCPAAPRDEDPDLRLQPDDAAGPRGAGPKPAA